MRNWHHKVIKIQEARDLLTSANNLGNSNIYVGVIEGQIEFEVINNNSPLEVSNYKASHNSFSDIGGSRKVFHRGVTNNNKFTQKLNFFSPSMHTTCVTGIISGNLDTSNLIDGICPNVRIINANEFQDALHLTLVNNYSNKNLKSTAYQSIFDAFFLNNGPDDLTDIYSSKFVSIINCSFNVKAKYLKNNKEVDFSSVEVDFILKELFAYSRNGRGTLVIVSAGNGDSSTGNGFEIDDVVGSTGFRTTVFSNKTLIVAASKVLLDEYPLPSYSIPNPIFKEKRADYSNYGKRIDICAPSGPDAFPSKEDISIYSPTMLNCGNVGKEEQILSAKILQVTSNWLSSGKLILENIKGVFKGQSIEIGNPESYFHELRYITKVEEIPNTNNVEITLDAKFKYTKDFNDGVVSYSMVDPTRPAKIVVFKKGISRYTDTATGFVSDNKIVLDNLKGINPTLSTPQNVYIYPKNSPLSGIYTKITSILNQNTNLIEIQDSLTNLPSYSPVNDPLILIPDQISASLECKGKNSTFFANSANDNIGFFAGQEVLVSSPGQNDRISFITKKRGNGIEMSHCPGIIGNTYKITSLAYGDFSSRFTGTSAATPVVSGLAGLILSANENLNVVEIKHILKVTADQIGNVTYNDAPSNATKYNYGYAINKNFGTGRVNAESAIKLALNWHQPDLNLPLIYPDIPVLKPRLEIADQLSGTSIINVPITDPVDSPDIWVSTTENTLPTPSLPLNTIDTSKNQFIHVKVRNTGNRDSFIESDLRVLIAFTDEENPAFPFPEKWHEQDDVKLLAVKTIPITSASSETVIKIEWNDIAAKWNQINSWNPIDSVTGLRKRTYILAHIAPFDGLNSDVQLDNIRNNKQLTCKEIIVTHNGVNDRTAFLQGNKLDITVGQELVSKSFDLSIENILETDLATTKVKATRVNRADQSEVSVFFSKNTNGDWEIEGGVTPDWITFDAPNEIASQYSGYKYVKFPHTIIADNSLEEIKIETLNA